MERTLYPGDLTDEQWKLIEPWIPPPKPGGRPREADMHRFAILPRRRIVERTFAWMSNYRRLSKDYETLPTSSEMMINLAMINLMIHRLRPG